MSGVVLGDRGVAGLEARRRAFERFERWDDSARGCLDAERALRAVAALYRLLPKSSRDMIADPEYVGVRAMHSALQRWDAATRGA